MIGPGNGKIPHSRDKAIKLLKDLRAFAPQGIDERMLRTGLLVNYLLKKISNKKWVDGQEEQAQVVDKGVLNGKMIITPHHKKEYEMLFGFITHRGV